VKIPEMFMKIPAAFCVFLYADIQTHVARLIETSLEMFISNIPQKWILKWRIADVNTL
jgi:hypothetical protein